MDFKRFKGVILDFDGTLADSLGVWSKIDEDFFAKRGREVPKGYVKKISSMNLKQAAEHTIAVLGLSKTPEQVIDEWYDLALFEHKNNVRLKSGVKEFLRLVKERGIKIAIASASDTGLIVPALENNGARSLIDVFATTDEVSRRKGFPDVYDLARDRLGLKTEECVVFEDILEAVRGAKLGGYFTVGVYDEHSKADSENIKNTADFYINSFDELVKILEK